MTMKYKIIASILFLTLAFSQFIIAQPPGGKGKMSEEARAKIKALHKAYVTDKLDLSEEEATAFWPIYNEYKVKEKELHRAFKKKKRKAKEMSDAEADDFIMAKFELEQNKLELKRETYAKLKPIISSAKIMRLEKIEKSFRVEVMKRMKENRERKRGERERERVVD